MSHNAPVPVSFACIWRLLVMLVLAGQFAGCASNPATGGTDFVLMSEEKEIDIGIKTHQQQIMRRYKIYPDPALQEYVKRVGDRLADVGERPHLRYTFTVLDSEEVNAFAVPGGFVYVTRGLLVYLNSEAELAAVLGHEVAHITARHAVRQHRSSTLLGVVGTVASVATGGAGSALTNLFGGALVSGYGRDMELEADELGARYLAKTGYDTEAMIDVVRILKNQELFELERAAEEGRDPRVYHGIFASHPDNDTRLRSVVKEADKLEDTSGRPSNRDAFLDRVDGMRFGKVKAGGVVRDSEFRHGGLGIGVRFPTGWKIDDAPGKLTATAPDGRAILILTAQPVKGATLSPLNILQDKIGIENMREGRPVSPDGLNGYTGIAPDSNSPFGRRPVRYAAITHRNRAFVFAGASNSPEDNIQNDWKMLSAIKSLRLLDSKAKRSAKPAIVRVIDANAGMTIDRLAAASPLDQYAEQQLRLLNNMYPEGEPQAGQRVKVID